MTAHHDDAPAAGPYAAAAHTYWTAGWHGILPLPAKAKAPVPAGWTGATGAFPSYPDIYAWAEGRTGAGNIALRVPHHVVGIDVDAYPGKEGAATLGALEAAHGPLPPTWRSTSRGDKVSGIRFYRVPEHLAWPGELGGGIEVIQHRHRYAVVWPSVHPLGGTYRWVDPDGRDVIGAVPGVDDLPDLPESWVMAITGGQLATETPRIDVDTAQALQWLQERGGTTQVPCRAVRRALGRYVEDLAKPAADKPRHNVALSASGRFAHLAGEGHHGVGAALGAFHSAWVHTLAQGPAGRAPDRGEWSRAVTGAVAIAGAAHPGPPRPDPCDISAGLLDAPAVFVRPTPQQAPEGAPQDEQAPTGADGVTVPVEPADTSCRRLILTAASTIRPRRVKWMWAGRIALGTFSLLAGREGLGKSTVAYWMVARITRGELDGEHYGTPRAVLVCATEDSWEHTIVPRLMAAGADLDRVYRVEVISADDVHVGLTLPRDLVAVEEAALEYDAALLLLDPLMSRLDAKLDSHRDGEVRQALEPLTSIAERTGMAVLGIIHHNKSGGSDPLDSVMASKAFTAVARSVHTAMRDPDDETEERRLFGTPKNNLGRADLPTLTFTIVGHPISTVDGDAWTGRVEWGRDSEVSISQAMETASRGGGAEDRTAAQEAGDWLYDWLHTQGGEASSKDAKDAAKRAGYSEPAMKRGLAARRALIGHRSEGFPRVTIWYLRPDPEAPAVGSHGGDAQ